MENSQNSIEVQIDNFLEHFKTTVSKSTDTSADWDSHSSSAGNDLLDRRSPCLDVADLLAYDNQIDIPIPNYKIYRDQPNKQQILMQQLICNTTESNSQKSSIAINSNIPISTNSNGNYSINQSNTTGSISNVIIDRRLRIADVADLLHPQHVIITGGRSRDGCPLLLFPDNNNFHCLEDSDYKTLILYLTSVTSMQDADLGFHIIIDRRKDKWTSVKAILLKISAYFPGIIHVVYVLRPTGFFQKAISEVSSKFFKDDFRFRIVFCSCIEDLLQELDESQLTQDMGGSLIYSHHEWIQQRISLEKFSQLTQQISSDLDIFIQEIHDTELPNSVEDTQQLIDFQGGKYEQLKDKILSAAKHGENLLNNMRSNDDIKQFSERAGNVSSIESAGYINHPKHHDDCSDYRRLLVQLEETERRFDEFWRTHQSRLKQCLDLRKFEHEFRELTINFDVHIQTVSNMTEIGDSVAHVDILINEAKIFQQMCQLDIDRAEKVISAGQQLIGINGTFPKEIVQAKSEELLRVCNIITDRLTKRVELLCKNRALMERVEKANEWCAKGVELLASQQIEKCAVSEIAEQNLREILEFISTAAEFKLSSPKEFKTEILESTTQETKALVIQVLQRIDDVTLMCDKRIACLKKLALKPQRPVQTVTPEPAVPLQPPGGAPHLTKRRFHNKFDTTDLRPRSMDGILEYGFSIHTGNGFSPEGSTTCQQDLEARKLKTGHVLHELLETEKIYVAEMNSILKGYRDQIHSEEMSHLIPPGLQEKEDILFGNLDELHSFHSNFFLKDLENCISTTELVALCFVQRRDTFYRLYSFYCQNIPRSDRLRETVADTQVFFQECQKRLGHKLPLGAYLLKPVQRITKYQLLLKDLLRFSDSSNCIQELQKALDCMLIVLKCVNDSMHQIAITGFPTDLSQQGELLLQDSFQIWTENKKDKRLRLKPQQRHIFLHEKAILFCKQASKTGHNKSTYQFKNYLKMSQIGLTESVRADPKRFEVWLEGRQEVYTLQAATIEIRNKWVSEIKRVLLNQLEELKGEKIKQYSGINQRNLRQTMSCDSPTILIAPLRSISSETSEFSNRNSNCSDECQPGVSSSSSSEKYNQDTIGWSSDCSNSEDELSTLEDITTPAPGNRYVALADYCAVGHAEVSIREGDIVELLKIGCAGWWFIKIIDTSIEGWTPGAYLEPSKRKTSRS